MSKKKIDEPNIKKEIDESNISLIVAAIEGVQESVSNVQKFVIDFKNDVHTKVNSIETGLSKKIDNLMKKIESIENSNKIIAAQGVQIKGLKDNIDDLAEIVRENKKDVDDKIKKHCDNHDELIRNVFNDMIKSYKAGILTKFFAWIGTPSLFLTLLTAILLIIKNGFSGFIKLLGF